MSYFYENKFDYFPKIQKDIIEQYIFDIMNGSSSNLDDVAENFTLYNFDSNIINKYDLNDIYIFLEECFEDTGYPDDISSVYDLEDDEIIFYLYMFMNSVVFENIVQKFPELEDADFDELNEEGLLDEVTDKLDELCVYYERMI